MLIYAPDKWGGRQGRYAQSSQPQHRSFDPFQREKVVFSRAYEYEAWVRARFEPTTASITHCRTSVAARGHATPLAAEATFVVKDRAGAQHYHLVGHHPNSWKHLNVLRRVAALNDAKVVITTQECLRKDVALFWRLDRLRAACVIHMHEGSGLDAQLLQAATAGINTRLQLQAQFRSVERQLIDARLGFLHCAGRLRLAFEDDDFGIAVPGVQR